MQSLRLNSVDSLEGDYIKKILDIATSRDFTASRPGLLVPVFFENSTRTLLSFERAAQLCGLDCLRFDAERSSSRKGETDENTLRTIVSLGATCIVLRCAESRGAERLSAVLPPHVSFINAGDGINEHPTQALGDLHTILQAIGRKFGEECLAEIKIAIVGDVKHSRVANSNIKLLGRFGAEIHLVAPPEFLPEDSRLKTFASVEEALANNVDFIMLLRAQKERFDTKMLGHLLKSEPEQGLLSAYRLIDAKLLTGRKVRILHPGPINDGFEISKEIAYNHPASLVSRQVENGLFVRSAILKLIHQSYK